MKDKELVRNNTLVKELVLVDGQGRSGKAMLGQVLGTMKRIEMLRLDAMFDYIPRYYTMGKISKDAAIVALNLEADENFYNTLLSRMVNFRVGDASSIFKSGKPFVYIRRAIDKSENKGVEIAKKERLIFQNLAHNGLSVGNIFFEAFGKRLKLIYIVRDPVENIYEFARRNFGERIGEDPREFQLAYKWKGKDVPHVAMGWEDEYLSANPTERIVGMIDHYFKLDFKEYKKLDEKWKKHVMFIEFEKFVENPMPHCEKIAKFLGTEMTRKTKPILRRERCPRVLDPELRKEKIRNIEKELSLKYKKKFRKLLEHFESRVWEKDLKQFVKH